LREQYYSFPERREITTPPFYETPFRMLARVHRSFLRLAVLACVFVFMFWAVVYALGLSGGNDNPPTQIALMRSHLLWPGSSVTSTNQVAALPNASAMTIGRAPDGSPTPAGNDKEAALQSRIAELEQQLEEGDYQSTKRFKEQYRAMAAQQNDIGALRTATAQLQQATNTLPEQISQANLQADAKVGKAIGEAADARQVAQSIQQQLAAKLADLETRASRAGQEVGRIEAQASGIGTRTEKLETDLINLTKQLEARTDELTNRTSKEGETQATRLEQLQRVAFATILSELKANTDEMERRVGSSFYRVFNKGEAQRDLDALKQRITSLTTELRNISGEQAKQLVEQLNGLAARVELIATRIK